MTRRELAERAVCEHPPGSPGHELGLLELEAKTPGRKRKPVDLARIRERRALGWGDKEIAAELGVSVSTIRRREATG